MFPIYDFITECHIWHWNEIQLDGNTTVKSKRPVNALGVKIDQRLTYVVAISTALIKAARQRALARISKYMCLYVCLILGHFFVSYLFVLHGNYTA